MKNTAISLKGVSKKYSIGKQKDGSLRGTLASMFSKKSASTEDFWALKDVSFDIQKGDVVGIIGKNGAGKSTLLKILSQITKPTEGRIEIEGRVASLLEVGTGFHPELTGRENVFLNGTILGMTRKEVAAKFDEIVAFSGVEKFIDTPVKRYSSGMYVRLAFAVAAHLEPEILIIDEVLAVGDAEFQKKCLGKMKDVAGEGRTVIFVSHDLAAVMSLCSKGILLESGKVVKEDNIKQILEKYNNNNLSNNYISNKTNKTNYIQIIEIENFNDKDKLVLNYEEIIVFNFKLKIDPENNLVNLGVAFKDFKGNKISTINKVLENSFNEIIEFKLSIDAETFYNGNYTIDCAVFEKNGQVYEYLEDCLSFKIVDLYSELSAFQSKDIGSIKINHEWIF